MTAIREQRVSKGVEKLRRPRIPDVVIRRLPLYLRVLDELDARGRTHVSSQELGERAGLTPAQVRKDLTVFGEFGKQGIGYEVRYLRHELQDILRLNRPINIALIGAGSLGTAVARYNLAGDTQHAGNQMHIKAIFDVNPNKIGKDIEGVPIYSVDELAEKIRELDIKMAIIAVPASAAQDVADTAVAAGVKTILNFAPARLQVPEDVRVHSSDVTLELQSLAFYTRDR